MEIFSVCAKTVGFLYFMRENLFTLSANSVRKLLIPREGNFHFIREPTSVVDCVTGTISWPLRPPVASNSVRPTYGSSAEGASDGARCLPRPRLRGCQGEERHQTYHA